MSKPTDKHEHVFHAMWYDPAIDGWGGMLPDGTLVFVGDAQQMERRYSGFKRPGNPDLYVRLGFRTLVMDVSESALRAFGRGPAHRSIRVPEEVNTVASTRSSLGIGEADRDYNLGMARAFAANRRVRDKTR